jgi:hypothetical protein
MTRHYVLKRTQIYLTPLGDLSKKRETKRGMQGYNNQPFLEPLIRPYD